MTLIKVLLEVDEGKALQVLAQKERRDVRAQAAVIIRNELERMGLLDLSPTDKQREQVPIPQLATEGR